MSHALSLSYPQLLGLSVATMVTLTYFGAHFAVIRRASLEKNPYQAVHQWGKREPGLAALGGALGARVAGRSRAQLDVSLSEWCQALGRSQRWSGAGRGCPGVLAPLDRASGLGDSRCSCLTLVPHRSVGTVWVYVGQGRDLALCSQG